MSKLLKRLKRELRFAEIDPEGKHKERIDFLNWRISAETNYLKLIKSQNKENKNNNQHNEFIRSVQEWLLKS